MWLTVIAATEGCTVGAVISSLARRSLAPVGIREEPDGLPVLDVVSDGPSFGEVEVARALDDE